MNIKTGITTTALALLALLSPARVDARDLYQLSWKGSKYTTSDSGHVIATRYSERDIIATCAADNGLSDTHNLALVYVANEMDIEVVFIDSGETVCEVFQLE